MRDGESRWEVPRPALFVAGPPARPVIDARSEAGKLLYHNPRTSDPLGHARRQRNVEVRAGTRGGDTVPPEGRTCALLSPHGASPPQTDEARSDSGPCEERSKRPATRITTTRP